MPTSSFPADDPVSGWTVVETDDTATDVKPRRRRPRYLMISAVVAILSLALFGANALFSSSNEATAFAGQPDKLRPGCTWDPSGNWVQNCKVYSPSQKKDVIVQIRASNGSNQGIYLLDGMRARDDRSAWTSDVKAAQIYDGSTDTTLVMPVGGASSFYTDWDAGAGDKNTTIKQETFLTEELPAYLAENFGVSPSNNAIVGLSMSGGPAVTLAERHPEQFKVVQAMSGYYQTDNPIGALGVFASQTLVSNYTNGIVNMWGAPGGERWAANDPSKNVGKLAENGQVLIISSGNGFLTPSEMAKLSPQDQISAIALEILSAVSTVLMQMQAQQAGANVVVLPNYGGHTWENWGRALRDGRPEVLKALRNNPPVTAKTQLVSASGTPAPDGAAKATAAAALAAKASPVLPAAITTASESSVASGTESSAASSAASSSAATGESAAPGTSAPAETPVQGPAVDVPVAGDAPVVSVPPVPSVPPASVPPVTGAAPSTSVAPSSAAR